MTDRDDDDDDDDDEEDIAIYFQFDDLNIL